MHLHLRLVALFFSLCFSSFAQVRLCSWNLENFGKSKNDSTIRFISGNLKGFDVVAITEVVAGKGGAQAVARLADELNRSGAKWDYCISDPTSGHRGSSERYAFLWKTSVLKKQSAFLEKKYKDSIEREPYLANFLYGDKKFTLAVFHAVPKNKQPEKEIRFLKDISAEYPGETLLFCGDFNCPESHEIFQTLKQAHYQSGLKNQKTTLKTECTSSTCLASEYDNIFFPQHKIIPLRADVLHFYKQFADVKVARLISDHLPVFLEFRMN